MAGAGARDRGRWRAAVRLVRIRRRSGRHDLIGLVAVVAGLVVASLAPWRASTSPSRGVGGRAMGTAGEALDPVRVDPAGRARHLPSDPAVRRMGHPLRSPGSPRVSDVGRPPRATHVGRWIGDLPGLARAEKRWRRRSIGRACDERAPGTDPRVVGRRCRALRPLLRPWPHRSGPGGGMDRGAAEPPSARARSRAGRRRRHRRDVVARRGPRTRRDRARPVGGDARRGSARRRRSAASP